MFSQLYLNRISNIFKLLLFKFEMHSSLLYSSSEDVYDNFVLSDKKSKKNKQPASINCLI